MRASRRSACLHATAPCSATGSGRPPIHEGSHPSARRVRGTLARLEALPRRPLLRDRGTAALTAALTAARPAPGPSEAAAAAAWTDGQPPPQGSPPPSLSPCDRAQVLPRAASAAASRERAAPEQGGLPPAAPPPSGGQGALSAVEQHGAAARPGMHPGLRRLHLPRVAARQPQRDRTTQGILSRGARGQCLSMRECARMVYSGHVRYDRETKSCLSGRALPASPPFPFPYVSFSLVFFFS